MQKMQPALPRCTGMFYVGTTCLPGVVRHEAVNKAHLHKLLQIPHLAL